MNSALRWREAVSSWLRKGKGQKWYQCCKFAGGRWQVADLHVINGQWPMTIANCSRTTMHGIQSTRVQSWDDMFDRESLVRDDDALD